MADSERTDGVVPGDGRLRTGNNSGNPDDSEYSNRPSGSGSTDNPGCPCAGKTTASTCGTKHGST